MSGSFMDYAFPRADIVPNVKFDLHNSPCKTNPLGVKGIGESGTIGAPPSIINAIIDALRPLGVQDIDMPATPSRVWAAMQQAKAAS
jgi:carbon-monoxide dehydrogenase large subunit